MAKPLSMTGYLSIVLFEFFRSFSYYGVQVMLFFLFYTVIRWPLSDSLAMVHLHGLIFYLSAMAGVYTSKNRKYLFVNGFAILALIGNLSIFACVFVQGMAQDWDYLQMFMEATLVSGVLLRGIGAGFIREIPMRIGEDMAATEEDPRKTRSRFYLSLFYAFSGGIGLATLLLPSLRMNVVWAGMNLCWPLPIGIACISLLIGILVFNGGTVAYMRAEPLPNDVKKISQCLMTGDAYRKADYRVGAYDDEFAEDAGQAGRVAILFIPLPIFWALFEQLWSRWPYQGLRMNGLLNGTVPLEPDTLFVAVPLVNMFVLPFFEYILFPLLLNVIFCRTPKFRICLGAIFALLAFLMACFVEGYVEGEKEVVETRVPGTAEIIFLNPAICQLNFTLDGLPSAHKDISIEAHSITFFKNIPCNGRVPFKIKSIKGRGKFKGCRYLQYPFNRTYHMYQNMVSGFIFANELTTDLDVSVIKRPVVEEVFLRDPVKGGLQVPRMSYGYKIYINRSIAVPSCHNISLYNPLRLSNRSRHLYSYRRTKDYELFPSGKYYPLYCGRKIIGTDYFSLKKGGVYVASIIHKQGNRIFGSVSEMEKPFKHALTWQVPQYCTMAMAQLLCPALVLDYCYRQVNRLMVPWLLMLWLFMAALGNLIVFVESFSTVFSRQLHAYYFYLALMVVGVVLMCICCFLYEHLEPELEEEEEEEARAPGQEGARR